MLARVPADALDAPPHRRLRRRRLAQLVEQVEDRGTSRHVDVQTGLGQRSEEHTSELQSLMRISYAVFCLKKKTESKCSTKLSTRHTTLHHRPPHPPTPHPTTATTPP